MFIVFKDDGDKYNDYNEMHLLNDLENFKGCLEGDHVMGNPIEESYNSDKVLVGVKKNEGCNDEGGYTEYIKVNDNGLKGHITFINKNEMTINDLIYYDFIYMIDSSLQKRNVDIRTTKSELDKLKNEIQVLHENTTYKCDFSDKLDTLASIIKDILSLFEKGDQDKLNKTQIKELLNFFDLTEPAKYMKQYNEENYVFYSDKITNLNNILPLIKKTEIPTKNYKNEINKYFKLFSLEDTFEVTKKKIDKYSDIFMPGLY